MLRLHYRHLLFVLWAIATFVDCQTDVSTPTPDPNDGGNDTFPDTGDSGGGTSSWKSNQYFSFKEAAWKAYQDRVKLSLDKAAEEVVYWAYQAKPSPANIYYQSMWLVGGALTRASNSTVKEAALKMTGSLLVQTLTPDQYFTGGNMGWPAWAFAAVYAQFQNIFDSDSTLYAPIHPMSSLITENVTTPQNISTLFKIAFKYGIYLPIDSTSNHLAMNSVARFLIEYALPGQCNFWYNGRVGGGSFGETRMKSIIDGIRTSGFGEYGSPNYGPYNFMILQNVAMLDPVRVANLKNATAGVDMKNLVAKAKEAYQLAVLQVAIYWFRGHWAMACGRGYPITGAWGPSDSTLSCWIYFGGEFPRTVPAGHIPPVKFSGSVKSTGLNAAIASYFGFQMPLEIIMAGAAPIPRRSSSTFALNYQTSYITANYSHYSEAGRLWQQASWRARATFLTNTTYNLYPLTFAVNPSGAYSIVVDPVTLETSHLYGSVTYGTSPYENFLQSDDAVMQVTFIPKGCSWCIKGEIIYISYPSTQAKNYYVWVPPSVSPDYVLPVLTSDGRRLFYGYPTMFVAVLSYTPITQGTKFNTTTWQFKEFADFYNIYGSSNGSIVDNSVYNISIGLAMETYSPYRFPGNTLNERFANFVNRFKNFAPPNLVGYDNVTGSPTFTYQTFAGNSLQMTWVYNRGSIAYINGKRVDYSTMSFMRQEVVLPSGESSVWIDSYPNGTIKYNVSDFFIPTSMILSPAGPGGLTVYTINNGGNDTNGDGSSQGLGSGGGANNLSTGATVGIAMGAISVFLGAAFLITWRRHVSRPKMDSPNVVTGSEGNLMNTIPPKS